MALYPTSVFLATIPLILTLCFLITHPRSICINKSIDSDNNTITNIVNADIKSSAAIADTKLDTISTANKVALTALDIDGATDIGEAVADADLFIIDNGAGGTNRKVTASALKTYAGGSSATKGFATAMAIAL